MTTENRYIIEGLHTGNTANDQMADAIASRTAKMLDQSLKENFETILQAKLSMAVQETLNLHTQRTQAYAKAFLTSNKTDLARSIVDTQHQHRLTQLQTQNTNFLDDFDTDLLPEVKAIGEENGAITIEVNTDSTVGF